MKVNGIAGFLSLLLIVAYFLVYNIEVEQFEDMSRFAP